MDPSPTCRPPWGRRHHRSRRWSGGARLLALVGLAWVCAAAPVPGAEAEGPAGGIRGLVHDREFGDPLANVQVTVQEAGLTTLSGADGSFRFGRVAPGRYTVTFARDGYLRAVVPEVTVTPGAVVEVRTELHPETLELEEMVVTGGDLLGGTQVQLLEVRQEAVALTDAVGADLIKRAGASTAADALRLVVGTSVQDGKFVVVRGLSDRYTITLLNQVRLPTADAEKRAVQVDQFPGSLLESITVSKTFTPEQPGDATGGSVDIHTKAIPEGPFCSVSGAVEYNTQATGNDRFLTYRGGGTEPLGMAGSDRDRPIRGDQLPQYNGASVNASAADRANAETIDRITRSFVPVMGTERQTAPPNYSWSLSAGDQVALGGDEQLGWLAGLSYRQKYQFYDDGKRNIVTGTGAGDPLNTTLSYDDTRGVDELTWGGVGGLGYRLDPDQQLALNVIYTQSATDEARLLQSHVNPTTELINQALRYQERSLLSVQLHGDHKLQPLGDLQLDWTAAYNTVTQTEPDFRAFREQYNPSNQIHSITGSQFDYPRRVFRDISEDDFQGLANLDWPFNHWTKEQGHLRFGPFVDYTDREFQQDTFFYNFAGQAGSGPAVLANKNLQVYRGPGFFPDVFLDPGRVGLATNNPPAANQLLWYLEHPNQIDFDYKGHQEIVAGYIALELPLTDQLKLIGGVRLEATTLSIDVLEEFVTVPRITENGDTYFEIVPGDEAGTNLDELHVLPSVGLVWEPLPRLFARLNFSQTIARPTFRELSPVRTYDFIGGDVFIGNNELTISTIDNYDLRVEWFRRPGDVLAVSLFYKDITDPIEQITFDVAGGDRYTQRVNYPAGRLYGIEGEIRQRLDVLQPWLAHFTLGFNASYIQSAVQLPADERGRLSAVGIKTKERPLLGQPEYLINANLVYDNPRSGTTLGLFAIFTGEVLVSGESRTAVFIPSLYELPSESLDFTAEQKIGPHWKVSFRAKNLTNPVYQRAYKVSWEHGETLQSSYQKGIDLSLGATYSW